ncbi:MAG: TraR/DksA C4-type zinc finger protein [Alphaproteobacteria bacterium]|nr:TraR/DksA C4-type zinc finger protein [Alphaproteobacteria bacterium]
MPIAIDPAPYRERLEAELKALESESADAKESRAPVELDQQSVGRLSRMDALQVQAMAQETERRRQGRIKVIGAALKRIDEGDFGFCIACGEGIPAKRLELDPATPTCVDCAGAKS